MGKSKRSQRWPDLGAALPAPVTDNHTHLPVRLADIPLVQGERLPLPEQLRRAAAVGVERVITVGCELPDLAASLELGNLPGVRVALAVHPNEAPLHAGVYHYAGGGAPDGLEPRLLPHHATSLDDAVAEVARLAADPRVVAVGESGLDYFRGAPPARAAQQAAFRAHIALAKELDKPLQIHDRDAHQDVIDILLADGAPARTVFHCFSGDAEMAGVLAEHGWFASIAGPVTYHANEEARRALRVLPRHLVLVETDAPYLAPHPLRGRPNASYVMPVTVRAMAEVWQADLAGVCRQLERNTQAVYGTWPPLGGHCGS